MPSHFKQSIGRAWKPNVDSISRAQRLRCYLIPIYNPTWLRLRSSICMFYFWKLIVDLARCRIKVQFCFPPRSSSRPPSRPCSTWSPSPSSPSSAWPTWRATSAPCGTSHSPRCRRPNIKKYERNGDELNWWRHSSRPAEMKDDRKSFLGMEKPEKRTRKIPPDVKTYDDDMWLCAKCDSKYDFRCFYVVARALNIDMSQSVLSLSH